MISQKITLTFGGVPITLYLGVDVHDGRHRWDVKRHCNGDYELHIILKGACRVNVEKDTYTFQPGVALLIAPGLYHCADTISEDFLHFSISFSAGSPAAMQLPVFRNVTCRIFQVDSQVQDLCRAVFQELDSVSLMQQEMLGALLSQIFVRIFRILQTSASRRPSAPTAVDWRTAVIDDFFETHVASHGAKEVLAKQLNLSMRQLDRILQEHYGMSFRQKLLQARMDYAAWLLRTTDHKISEIQQMTGYASATTFFQAFEAAFSTTPKQYRTLHRNDGKQPECPQQKGNCV